MAETDAKEMADFRRLRWLPLVRNPFCCCSLETYSKIYGYISSVLSMGVVLGMLTPLILDGPRLSNTLIAVIIVVFIVEGLICFVLSIHFTTGVYQRHHGQLMPFVVFLHVRVALIVQMTLFVASLMPTLVAALGAIPVGAVFLSLTIYSLLCVNSLRVNFAEEDAVRARMQSPPSRRAVNDLSKCV